MSLQHLLRRNCQLFWFLLNCVMLSSVGNCPLVTSLGPLNSNPNLAFWRWRAALIHPGTILWAPSPLYFTYASKVSRTNLHLKPVQNKGWSFVSLPSEFSLTLGIFGSRLVQSTQGRILLYKPVYQVCIPWDWVPWWGGKMCHVCSEKTP